MLKLALLLSSSILSSYLDLALRMNCLKGERSIVALRLGVMLMLVLYLFDKDVLMCPDVSVSTGTCL